MNDIDETKLPTKKDVTNVCDSIMDEIQKINDLRESDQEMRFKSYDKILELLEKLKSYEGVENFSDILFDSALNSQFSFLVSTPNTEISSSFISLLTDICENSNMVDVVKRSDYLVTAIKFCVPLNEVNIQTDAQFLYNTFNLISVILDGCEDAAGFAATLLKDTEILSLIKRQLTRDDFDDNVLAATETLAILLQMQPNFISDEEEYTRQEDNINNNEDDETFESGNGELLNLLLRFVANEMNPKSASEDEAAHNGFNAVSLFALNEKGNELLVQLNGIEMLLNCWNSKAKTAMLAVKTIETALSASTPCCIQFINAGGLKKLSQTINDPKTLTSKKICSSVIGILDALLTMLPLPSSNKPTLSVDGSPDPDGKYFKKVIKLFKKDKKADEKKEKKVDDKKRKKSDDNDNDDKFEKIKKFIKICEFIFDNVSEDDTESMDVFQMCACCIAILCGYSSHKVVAEIISCIAESETIDFPLIIDSAELRIDEAKTIADRVNAGLDTIVGVIGNNENEE